MLTQRSPNEWFRIWRSIIEEKKEINRVDLADLSGCSLWTLRALTKDFTNREYYVTYKNNKFHYLTFPIEHTLSALSEVDRKELA